MDSKFDEVNKLHHFKNRIAVCEKYTVDWVFVGKRAARGVEKI